MTFIHWQLIIKRRSVTKKGTKFGRKKIKDYVDEGRTGI
jgi:hypothetical protein